MTCASCGRENRADAVFCDQCGAKLVRACTNCDRVLAADARFCDGCGTQLETASPSPQSEPQARSLRAYTPRHLADKILNQRSALEGEHKQVTVLFVDIQSSLQLTEGLASERWHQILDHFFQILANGVHRFEGTVNQYTGDGIMALFGAPIAHEDHAQRACYATLHLSREIRRYAQKLRREEGLDIAVRMGLNSGEVVVGRIGDDLRMDYTAQGHTVGLAARMEKLAESGKAYLTGATAALVSGYFELESLGSFRIEGHSEPLEVFALEKAGPLRTRLEVARSRGFSAFVGREAELTLLDEALAQSGQHGGQGIGIAAEPGVGKSRLCYEFAERCHAKGIDVTWGHGVSHGRSVPYLPVRQSLREAFRIAEEDDSRVARQRVAGALLLADREIANDLPLVFDFLGIASPDDPPPLVEGEGRERRLFTIVKRFIAAAAEDHPVVMILEDLQWYDSASQSFTQNLLAGLSDSNVLIVFNYRPEYRPPWLGAKNFREIRLDPLGDTAVSNLLQSLLGNSPELGTLSRRIRETARGNPFFVEEVVQSLVDSGVLSGSRGGYQLLHAPGELAIPSTVQALLAARVDRLPARDKEILETAAVIGKRFSERVLARVTGLGEEELAASLRNLIDSEFMSEVTLYPDRELMFKHPLMQEVAYQSQLTAPRAALHSEVARAHEDVLENSLDENAALIAHHWEQSGNSLAAARWVHRAARWLTQSHPGEAMELWRKLLRLLDASPSTAEIAFVRARACRWMLWLAASQGMPVEEASDLFDQGRASSEKTRDRRSLALTLANYGYYQSQIQVNPELSLQLTEQAREIADASPNPWLKPTIDIRRTQALTFAGRFPEAIELGFDLLERIADGTAPEIDPLDHVTLHSIVGDALTELGRPRDGIQITTDGLDLATQQDLALNAGHCHITLVRILAALGKGAQTDTHAAAAMRAAERTGNTALMVFAHDATSVAHLINGRPEAAVASSLEALALSRERQVGRISESLHLAHLCLAELQSGDMASAVESGERAVNAIERCGPRFAPRAYLALACALRRRDGIKQQARIETLLGAADDCITATHAELYRPNAAEERAKLLLLSGDKNGARTLLTSAVEGLASLGADASARRVQSLLGQL